LSEDRSVPVIEFPVLWFERGRVWRNDALDEMTAYTKLALKKQFSKGALLVNRRGQAWQVTSVDVVHMLMPRSVGELIGFLEGNPRYRVTFEMQPKGVVGVQEVKEKIAQSFEVDPWWQGVLDFEEFRNAVERARSVDEIIDVFITYHQ